MDTKRIEKDHVIRVAASEAAGSGVNAWLVGGMVRNLALGLPAPPDYDFVVEADSKDFSGKIAADVSGTAFPLDEENGIWRVVAKKKDRTITIDFSALKEKSIIDDLSKRDFTINAMAVHLENMGEIIDPLGGVKDARRRTIKASSETVFRSDPLRALRAFRLSGQYGLEIDKSTLVLMREAVPRLGGVAAERIREELVQVFAADAPSGIVDGLYRTGLMQMVLPETQGWHDVKGYDLFSHSLKTLIEAEKILSDIYSGRFPFHEKLRNHLSRSVGAVKRQAFFKMSAFLHDIGKPFKISFEGGRARFISHDFEGGRIVKEALMRLRFSKRFSTALSEVVKNHHRTFMLAGLEERSPRTKGHFFRAAGDTFGLDLLLLSLADARATRGSEDPELFEVVKEMLEFYYFVYTRKKPKPLLTGTEVMRLFNVKQGPIVGRILAKISEGIEAGVISDKKGAAAFIREWLDKNPLSG